MSGAPTGRGAAGGPDTLGIVIVIAQYPPHHRGGYELRCRDVATELARRGHRVTVLTSREGGAKVEVSEGVRVVRKLRLWPDGVRGGRAALAGFLWGTSRDVARLRRETRRARADVVAYWHQSGLTSALLAVRPPAGCGVLCDVSSDWLTDAATTGGNWFRIWEKRASTGPKRWVKGLLRPLVGLLLRVPVRRPTFPPGRAYFTSDDRLRRTRDAGVPLPDAARIQSGIDLERFRFRGEKRWDGPVHVLALGRMKRRKGLHTVVLALGDLPPHVRLRAVGAVDDPEYLAEVGELAAAAKVTDRIEVRPQVPHAEVPEILGDGHVLVFSSEEPEPFSRLVLEAFATGTPVVGTTLGGTGEVLREGETGLTYPPGNARELGRQLRRILDDAALRERVVANGRRLVATRYALGFTVDQIEELLRDARDRARRATPDAG